MNPDVLPPSRKPRRTAVAALALVSLAALATPAAAQWGPRYNAPAFGAFEDDGEAMVPPERVMRWVARQGFSEVTRPRLSGSTYVIDGIAPDGTRTRFTIDAYDGQLIASRRVGRVADVEPDMGLRPPGLIPRRGPAEYGEAPLPPGVLPPRGGPPEYGETAPRPRAPVASAPAHAPRQAMRDEPATIAPPPAGAAPAPSGIYGLNPGSRPEPAARPAQRPAPKPRATAAAPAPAAPAAPVATVAPVAPAPAASAPAAPVAAAAPKAEASASAAPRGPVRIIEGVTPVLPKTEGTPPDVRVPEPPPVTPPTALQ